MDRIAEYSGGVAVIPHDRIKDAATKLAAYEDTGLTPEEITDGKMLTGWIPVTERLPGRLVDVLVSYDTGDIDIDYWGSDDDDYTYHFYGKAMAWTPLTEPYKPDGQ